MIRNNTKFKIIINSLISMNNKNIFEKLILFKFFTILAFLILFFIFYIYFNKILLKNNNKIQLLLIFNFINIKEKLLLRK